MRQVLAAAVLSLAIAAGAALAQTADVDDPILVYRSRPSIETILENYPNNAYSDRREGYAELCCLVRDNGTMACAVVGESPTGYGFGEAARRVANEIRLTEQSAAAVRQRGQPLRVPIYFRQARFEPAPRLESQPRCGTLTTPAPEPSPQPQTEPLTSAQG